MSVKKQLDDLRRLIIKVNKNQKKIIKKMNKNKGGGKDEQHR